MNQNNFATFDAKLKLTSSPTILCCRLSRGLDNLAGLKSNRILDIVQSMRCNCLNKNKNELILNSD